MHIDLSGKRAIVTGSTAGIGFAIASGLADQRTQREIRERRESAPD
jgi:NAD(P)-dependent dehydrogenase (short-subunit alcohol dehydrogenase family)